MVNVAKCPYCGGGWAGSGVSPSHVTACQRKQSAGVVNSPHLVVSTLNTGETSAAESANIDSAFSRFKEATKARVTRIKRWVKGEDAFVTDMKSVKLQRIQALLYASAAGSFAAGAADRLADGNTQGVATSIVLIVVSTYFAKSKAGAARKKVNEWEEMKAKAMEGAAERRATQEAAVTPKQSM